MIADSTRNKTAQKPLGLHYNEISISAPCNDSALASTRHRKSQILWSSWESRVKRQHAPIGPVQPVALLDVRIAKSGFAADPPRDLCKFATLQALQHIARVGD